MDGPLPGLASFTNALPEIKDLLISSVDGRLQMHLPVMALAHAEGFLINVHTSGNKSGMGGEAGIQQVHQMRNRGVNLRKSLGT